MGKNLKSRISRDMRKLLGIQTPVSINNVLLECSHPRWLLRVCRPGPSRSPLTGARVWRPQLHSGTRQYPWEREGPAKPSLQLSPSSQKQKLVPTLAYFSRDIILSDNLAKLYNIYHTYIIIYIYVTHIVFTLTYIYETSLNTSITNITAHCSIPALFTLQSILGMFSYQFVSLHH